MYLAQYSSQADRFSAEGEKLPSEYERISRYISEIDEFKAFLPLQAQQMIATTPAEKDPADSPGLVSWQELEGATHHAWLWLLNELVSAALLEGPHEFLSSRQERVRASWNTVSVKDL